MTEFSVAKFASFRTYTGIENIEDGLALMQKMEYTQTVDKIDGLVTFASLIYDRWWYKLRGPTWDN